MTVSVMPKSVSLKTAGTTIVWSSTMNPLFKRFPHAQRASIFGRQNMLQKIQRFGGAMFAPAMLFSISGLMVGVSALATTADIVGDLAVYGTPWYVFDHHPARLVDGL